jgi:hypothetical protein
MARKGNEIDLIVFPFLLISFAVYSVESIQEKIEKWNFWPAQQ